MTDAPHNELRDSVEELTNEIKLLRASLDEFEEIFEWAAQNHHGQVNDGRWSQAFAANSPETKKPHSANTSACEKKFQKPSDPELLF